MDYRYGSHSGHRLGARCLLKGSGVELLAKHELPARSRVAHGFWWVPVAQPPSGRFLRNNASSSQAFITQPIGQVMAQSETPAPTGRLHWKTARRAAANRLPAARSTGGPARANPSLASKDKGSPLATIAVAVAFSTST